MNIKIRTKTYNVTTLDELFDLTHSSATAIKSALRQLEPARLPLESSHHEEVIRVTWTKPTRKYPSIPAMEMVTIADWNFSNEFAITDNGIQVKRSTLYRMPAPDRVISIFAGRNTVRN